MFGQQAIDGFVLDQINVDYIFKHKQAASGVAFIFVDKKGENSIAVAFFTKMIYQSDFQDSGENIYVTGLMHNIGLII